MFEICRLERLVFNRGGRATAGAGKLIRKAGVLTDECGNGDCNVGNDPALAFGLDVLLAGSGGVDDGDDDGVLAAFSKHTREDDSDPGGSCAVSGIPEARI